MKKIILFISQYSEENYLLSKEICLDNKNSCSFLCGYSNNKVKNYDYTKIISNIDKDLLQRFFVSNTDLSNVNIVIEIYNFIQCLNILPDLIVCKGNIKEIFAISAIKQITDMEIPIFCLLENVQNKYSNNCLKGLQFYDKIFLMDDVPTNILPKNKIKILFQNFITSKIKMEKDVLNGEYAEKLDEIIIFTNNKNYNKIYSKIKNLNIKANICSYENIDELDFSILIMLNSKIIDFTENKDFPIIISKIGRKIDFLDNKIKNNNKNIFNNEAEKFKVFSKYIKKVIYNEMKKVSKSLFRNKITIIK